MSDQARQQRTVWCWFCDDVRFEVGNKMSLMGIYGGEIYLIGKPPTILPKIVLVLEVITDFEDLMGDIGVRVKMRGADDDMLGFTVPAPMRPPRAEDTKRWMVRMPMPISPFVVAEEGILEVYTDIGGDSTRAGRIGIHFVPPQDAQPSKEEENSTA